MSTEDREPVAERPNDELAAVTREAANRRRELRAEQAARAEVEAERDALLVRLDESDRREVEAMAKRSFADPSDFWLEKSLDDVRDENGKLDPALVKAALTGWNDGVRPTVRVVESLSFARLATPEGGRRTNQPHEE